VRIAFLALTPPHPVGGVAAVFDYAAALARRGHDVHLFHLGGYEAPATRAEDIDWYRFDERLVHHFAPGDDDDRSALAAADVVFGFDLAGDMPAHRGLPVVLVQGYRMLAIGDEQRSFRAPCPKVCVARLLVDVGLDLGVPAAQLVHVPLGLDHDRFGLRRPVAGRPPLVTFCYNAHPQKGADLALDVLAAVREERPEVEAVAFGSREPDRPLPPWLAFRLDPGPDELVDLYNGTAVFLCTSEVEGFGLTCIEAMACGAALVTTDNGGSHDYAFDGETALVAPTGDADGLAAHVLDLLADTGRRAALATAGVDHVAGFDWDRSGELLDEFLGRYVADPAAYGYRRRR
jgi:glycosyltransferase involved in cell wall biosynthesis